MLVILNILYFFQEYCNIRIESTQPVIWSEYPQDAMRK